MTRYQLPDQIIKDLKECIVHKDVLLHSGRKSSWIFDILLLRDRLHPIAERLNPQFPPVGIENGGMLLALSLNGGNGILRKSGEYYPPMWASRSPISLIDDVVTTETSLRESIKYLEVHEVEVGEILCVLDRRRSNRRSLEVKALVTSEQLGISV